MLSSEDLIIAETVSFCVIRTIMLEENYILVKVLQPVQVLLNLWCVVEFIREVAGFGQAKGMTFWGNRYDPTVSGFKLGFIIWIHYNNKFVELLDTLWMLLRKKDKQVRSPLELFNHGLVAYSGPLHFMYILSLDFFRSAAGHPTAQYWMLPFSLDFD
jgi:hypothetical protein